MMKEHKPFTIPAERRDILWTDDDIEKALPSLIKSLRRLSLSADEKLAFDHIESWCFGKYLARQKVQ